MNLANKLNEALSVLPHHSGTQFSIESYDADVALGNILEQSVSRAMYQTEQVADTLVNMCAIRHAVNDRWNIPAMAAFESLQQNPEPAFSVEDYECLDYSQESITQKITQTAQKIYDHFINLLKYLRDLSVTYFSRATYMRVQAQVMLEGLGTLKSVPKSNTINLNTHHVLNVDGKVPTRQELIYKFKLVQDIHKTVLSRQTLAPVDDLKSYLLNLVENTDPSVNPSVIPKKAIISFFKPYETLAGNRTALRSNANAKAPRRTSDALLGGRYFFVDGIMDNVAIYSDFVRVREICGYFNFGYDVADAANNTTLSSTSTYDVLNVVDMRNLLTSIVTMMKAIEDYRSLWFARLDAGKVLADRVKNTMVKIAGSTLSPADVAARQATCRGILRLWNATTDGTRNTISTHLMYTSAVLNYIKNCMKLH